MATLEPKWINLLINGKNRPAEAVLQNGQYWVQVPAQHLVDGSGTGQANPSVQGHEAIFDKDGNLVDVKALGWNADSGFYRTEWPTKEDSLYNANAAKTYALQVFRQMKKDGGWLNKFQGGGTTLQQFVSQEQDVMNTIDAAIGEIQTKRPGQAVQKLAAMMQDPNYSMIIDMIKQEYPQIESVLNTVEQMVGTYKCGGKTKKKVKKGAKGCIPCKKLMRVGGKLINVLVDCEGKPIHKNAKGGWIVKAEDGIPGGFKYGSDNLLTMEDINKTTGKQGDVRYFFDLNNGSVMQTSWNDLTSKWETAIPYSNANASYGIGDNQINLWKDGYNPATGLKKGETFTYTDRFGITRRANTKDIDGTDALASVWHQNTDGGERTRKGVGFNDVISTDPNGHIKDDLQIIEYMPSAWRLRRAMRDERNKLFWLDVNDNNMSKSKARVQRRQRRLLHENFISGAHRDMKDAQVTTGDSYIDARNKWKAYRRQSLGTNPQKVKPVFDEYKL